MLRAKADAHDAGLLPTDGSIAVARRALDSAQTLVDIQLRVLSAAHDDAQAARTALRRSRSASPLPPDVTVANHFNYTQLEGEYARAPAPKRHALILSGASACDESGSSSAGAIPNVIAASSGADAAEMRCLEHAENDSVPSQLGTASGSTSV